MTIRCAIIVVVLAGCPHAASRPVVIENRAVVAAPAGRFRGAITEVTLEAMMRKRFEHQLAAGTFVADFSGTTADLLTELDAMGIHDLGQLAALIPRDYDRRAEADFATDSPANIPGVLRDLFIIHDARRYFRDAWQNHWQSLSPDNLPMYRSYRVDLQILVEAGVISAGATAASSP